MGGADFILALSAGRFRQMGRSSLASYLPYANSNDVVMKFASRELLPIMQEIPIIFGVNASDPSIDLFEYIADIKEKGFAGVNNFPTVGLIDGNFGEALAEEGITYEKEVEAIKIAHNMDLFTVAFVFNEEQTLKMLEAGADILCVHLGLSVGGLLGATKALSLETSRKTVNRIYQVCQKSRPEVIKMAYGGPIKSPIDAQFLYDTTDCRGFIGGSSFERIPAEQGILATTQAFKDSTEINEDNAVFKVLKGYGRNYDYVEYLLQYIKENYMSTIYLSELAMAAHVSTSYLSTKFKNETGYNFTEYLITFRMNKACEIINELDIPISQVAEMVGYQDYAQFSKMFKKYIGQSPKEYKTENKGKKK
jgi:predicted TIM-barrel enzyme/AraC-like DNA-binding protein